MVTNTKDSSEKVECKGGCGARISPDRLKCLDKTFVVGTTCRDCEEKRRREEDAEMQRHQHESRLKWFRGEFPPLYTDSDESRFPPEWAVIKGWRPGSDGRGLILVGDTGRAKTRMAAWLARELMLADIRVGYERAARLACHVRQQFSKVGSLSREARENIDKARRVRVLVLDDLGKQSNTAAVEEAVFDLIEERTAYLKPMIITVNAVGDELKEMMSADRGGPMVRRLREFCEPIMIQGRAGQ